MSNIDSSNLPTTETKTENNKNHHHFLENLPPTPTQDLTPIVKQTKDYWEQYYKVGGPSTLSCSSFALYVLPFIDHNKTLLEVGCGNGRDAIFFASNKIDTVAIDGSHEAIELLSSKIDKEYPQIKNYIECIRTDFRNLVETNKIELGTVYSRFTLHAVDKELATKVLNWSYSALSKGGHLVIEARSVLSDMYGVGTPVPDEPDAFINGHYRRFIRREQLIKELTDLGFTIFLEEEKKGVAVFGNDDPVVVRIIARK